MRKQIESIMKLLVGTNTTNPPGNEKALVDAIIPMSGSCRYQRIIHEPKRESLIITISGVDSTKTIGFAGHLDTVPTGNYDLWTHDPFGKIVGDIMYGRGTTDMCGGLTAMLLILEYYKKQIPSVNVKLIFTADEEAGGMGAKELVDQGYLKELDGIIICEPSNLELGISEKGTLWIRIIVKGISCHASMPTEGMNALQLGMNLVNNIKNEIESLTTEHLLLGKTTCEVTQCRSGVKINIIPEEAVFELDIRTIPLIQGGNETVLNIIREQIKGYEETYRIHIELEVLGNREAIEEPRDSEFIRHIKMASNGLGELKTRGINFFTDGSIIIPKEKLSFVILGPGNSEQCHKIDESISLGQIEQCFYLYQHIIDSYERG